MKRLYLLIVCLTIVFGASAQTMGELWASMPDSVAPYLNQTLREQMVQEKEAGGWMPVENLLGDTSVVSLLTSNYMKVKLSNSSVIELKLLDEKTIAMVQTWFGPEPESRLTLYSVAWQSMPSTFSPVCLTEKPDTMSTDEYEHLLALLEPQLIWLQLSEKDNSLSVQYAQIMLTPSERQEVSAIVKQTKYNWDGSRFK